MSVHTGLKQGFPYFDDGPVPVPHRSGQGGRAVYAHSTGTPQLPQVAGLSDDSMEGVDGPIRSAGQEEGCLASFLAEPAQQVGQSLERTDISIDINAQAEGNRH
jgi:hypothetical protein